MRLGVIEINTDSKIVNSMVNGFKGSVARNSPTSQDSWGGRGALPIMAYTRDQRLGNSCVEGYERVGEINK